MAHRQRIALFLLIGYYALAVLPYIDRVPSWDAAETTLIAPASNLAKNGVYGNPIYRDFHRTEQRNYEFMPLHPLQLTPIINLFGTHPVALRLLSFAYGLAAVIMLFVLTRELHDVATALVALAVLVGLRLATGNTSSGIPHADLARRVHYDILIPFWTLAACYIWVKKRSTQQSARMVRQLRTVGRPLLFGIAAGIATLAHVYGAFVIAIPLALDPRGLIRKGGVIWLIGGWLLAMLPFLLYVGQDVAAYQGQMTRHGSRFDVFSWQFYLTNLSTEQYRFNAWLLPADARRIGLFVLIAGVLCTHALLLTRRKRTSGQSFTLICLAAVWIPLLLLISFKRYAYVTLLMPFFAIQIAYAAVWLWRRSWVFQGLLSLVAIAAAVDSGAGVLNNFRIGANATPFADMVKPIAAAIPDDATVLGIPIFWMGLQSADFVGLDLAFVNNSAADTMTFYAPDFIVVQERILYEFRDNPAPPEVAERAARWNEILDYIAQNCNDPTTISDTATYGNVLLSDCR